MNPEPESPSTDWLSLGLLALLLGVLYLPFVNGAFDNLRWVLFSALIGAFLIFRLGDLAEPTSQTLLWLLGANAGLRVLSIFWSPDPGYTLLRAISLASMCIFLVVFAARACQARHFRQGMAVLAGYGGLLLLVTGVVYFAGWKYLPWNGYAVYRGVGEGRFCGIFGNPNQIGICAAVSVPLMVGLWMENRRRVWWLGLALLSVFLVLQSESRAGVLALLAGTAGMFLVYQRRAKGLILGVVALVSLVAMFGDTSALERGFASFASRGETTELNVEEIADNRMTRWTLGWQSIQKHFILGQGYGIGGVSDGVDPRLTDYDIGYPLHNSFLQVWQENGLAGLLLFLALIGGLYHRLLFREIAVPAGELHLLAGGLGVALAGVVSAFFESWLFSVGNLGTLPFWACMTLLWVRTGMESAKEEVTPLDQPWVTTHLPTAARAILPYASASSTRENPARPAQP